MKSNGASTTLKILLALIATTAIIAAAASCRAFEWQVFLPAGVMFVFALAMIMVARLSTAILGLIAILPWWTVIGSSYLPGPMIGLIPVAKYSGHARQFAGMTLGLMTVGLLAFWLGRARDPSALARYSLTAALIAVFAMQYQVHYGPTWHLFAFMELVLLQLHARHLNKESPVSRNPHVR